MEKDAYIRANRDMWNQTAEVYEAEGFAALLEAVRQSDFSTFDAVEQRVFAAIDLSGKHVIQLGCNNGRELISVRRAGAARCVGVDVSEKILKQAQQLAEASGQEITFIRSSLYDLDRELEDALDVVYVSIGVLGWLPDLPGFFSVVNTLLRIDGHLFLYDQHPILGMFDPAQDLVIDSSYFRQEPFVEEVLPDYMDPSQTGRATSYWFQHTLSDIISLCLQNGLNLTHFEEHEHDLSGTYRSFQDFELKPPLSFSLVAQKQGHTSP